MTDRGTRSNGATRGRGGRGGGAKSPAEKQAEKLARLRQREADLQARSDELRAEIRSHGAEADRLQASGQTQEARQHAVAAFYGYQSGDKNLGKIEAQLRSVRTQIAKLEKTPAQAHAEKAAQLRAQVDKAQAALDKAQAAYDAHMATRPGTTSGATTRASGARGRSGSGRAATGRTLADVNNRIG